MIFDDTFSTFQSLSDGEDPPVFWNEVALDSFTHQVPLEPGHSNGIHYEWLTPSEQENKRRLIQCEDHMHAFYLPSQLSSSLEEPLQPAPPSVTSATTTDFILHDSPYTLPIPLPPVAPPPITVPVTHRCSTNKTKGALAYRRFQDKIYASHDAQAFLDTLTVPTQSNIDSFLEYPSDINIDYDTVIIDCSYPRAFFIKTLCKYDRDHPSSKETMTEPHAQE